ncbi:MAG: hypothetical protein WCV00_02820 [Verrucomicrobiia bacterium]|jgi:hypothetical protein
MNVEILNTIRGRIAAHLICLGRSLWQGRFGSMGFFCAGIWRGLQEMLKGTWHLDATTVATGSRVSGVRW